MRKKEAILITIRLLGADAIAAVLILRVQDPGPHHQNLITPTVLIFLAAFSAYWAEEAENAVRPFIATGALLILTANFAFAFIPAFHDAAEALRPIPTTVRSYPKHLENYDFYRHKKKRGRGLRFTSWEKATFLIQSTSAG